MNNKYNEVKLEVENMVSKFDKIRQDSDLKSIIDNIKNDLEKLDIGYKNELEIIQKDAERKMEMQKKIYLRKLKAIQRKINIHDINDLDGYSTYTSLIEYLGNKGVIPPKIIKSMNKAYNLCRFSIIDKDMEEIYENLFMNNNSNDNPMIMIFNNHTSYQDFIEQILDYCYYNGNMSVYYFHNISQEKFYCLDGRKFVEIDFDIEILPILQKYLCLIIYKIQELQDYVSLSYYNRIKYKCLDNYINAIRYGYNGLKDISRKLLSKFIENKDVYDYYMKDECRIRI
jgi:hypothetical protein